MDSYLGRHSIILIFSQMPTSKTDEYNYFKHFVDQTIQIIRLDLDEMEKIAINNTIAARDPTLSSTTTTKTTIRPGSEVVYSCKSDEISRCTIPIAMVCFSVIDLFGRWLNIPHNDDFGNSAQSYFSKIAKRDDLKNPVTHTHIKECYRHSVMHSFFAQNGYGLAYNESDQILFSSDSHTSIESLNVKYLLEVVRVGMTNLERVVKNETDEITQLLLKGYRYWTEKN